MKKIILILVIPFFIFNCEKVENKHDGKVFDRYEEYSKKLNIPTTSNFWKNTIRESDFSRKLFTIDIKASLIEKKILTLSQIKDIDYEDGQYYIYANDASNHFFHYKLSASLNAVKLVKKMDFYLPEKQFSRLYILLIYTTSFTKPEINIDHYFLSNDEDDDDKLKVFRVYYGANDNVTFNGNLLKIYY